MRWVEQICIGRRRLATLAAVAAFLPLPLRAQEGGDSLFTRTEFMIPMRDGVKLYTQIYAPKSSTEKVPFLLLRTPYGIDRWSSPRVAAAYRELAEDGYVFVFQDIRGRFKSEGQFVMLRPPRDSRDKKAIDESTDAYDTIEWLLKNVPNNNGRVGALGVSYGGWLTAMAMLDPHPALKAVSPQASPADMYIGDDFHHNGAFRLSYGFEYAYAMESSKTVTPFKFDIADTYEWYLKLGPLSNANEKLFKQKLPSWNDFVSHPDYDAFWKRQAFAPYLNRVTVPTLNVAGWWDQEDFYGPLKIYELLERHDAKGMNFLVVGPWNHGGWTRGEGKKLGNIDFGVPTGEYYRAQVQKPFFAHYLKGKGRIDLPEALTFRTGANEWVRHTKWPPRESVSDRKLYFHPGGRLAFEPPAADDTSAYDRYVSDPAHPVPYRHRPIDPTFDGQGWPVWQTEDQRFVHLRPDVLSWVTEPLTEDVTISGKLMANLFAATSGSDGDWIVKVIDVYPEDYPADPKMRGYQLMVAGDVLRGRFRNGFERPEPVTPDSVTRYSIPLHGNDHRFAKGHRIMIQVQSSWFPLIDRNPQTFVPNIFTAKESDFRAATQRIFRNSRFSSHIVLPVVEAVRQ